MTLGRGSERLGFTIGIVGDSGSGKTTLGRELSKKLNMRMIDVGGFFRKELRRMKRHVQEGDDIPLRLDRRLDQRTSALLGDPVILVGRTVTWLARDQQAQGELGQDQYFGVGVLCNEDTLVERARKDWNRKKGLSETTPLPTPKHVRTALRLRDENDLRRYRELYGVRLKRELYGAPPNDIMIDTSEMSIGQELEFVLSQIAIFQSRMTKTLVR